MPDFGRVSQIDASAFDSATAYVAVKRPLLDDKAPYIFRTHDFGKTWTKIVNGIRADDYVHAVREDPTRKGLLYAGTQHGVYISYDDGDHWESLLAQPARHPGRRPDRRGERPRDLDARARLLHARQHRAAASVHAGDRVGQRPRTCSRPRRRFARATCRRDSVLAQAAGADVFAIEILDATGTASCPHVRPRRGARRQRPTRRRRPAEADARRAARPAAAASADGAGCNTFRWDLRYAPATTFPGMILWGATTNGPPARAGHVQVRLTADGKTLTQPLIVRSNPLLTTSTRRRSPGAVRARDPDPRQGERGERARSSRFATSRSRSPTAYEVAGRGAQDGGDKLHEAPERRGGGRSIR